MSLARVLPFALIAACNVAAPVGAQLGPPGTEDGDPDAGTDAASGTTVDASSEATGTGGATGADTTSSWDGGVVLDVMSMDDFPPSVCGCGADAGESFIWIANTEQGTVSKLNTETMEESGRFLTSADGEGDPSRTSVSLSGRAVGVANRNGGVTKLWTREEFCDDTDGTPGISTSTGRDDVRPWGTDECVAWHVAFPEYESQRPIAWAPGVQNRRTCEYEDELLWTSGCDNDVGVVDVIALDGDSGAMLDSASLSDFGCPGLGGYGGAVDADGNFWMTTHGTQMARVDRVTFAVDRWDLPDHLRAYGITVDSKGRPWISNDHQFGGVARFDPIAELWDATGPLSHAQTGLQEDQDGRMWFNYWDHYADPEGAGLAWVDIETLAFGPPVSLDIGGAYKGISIDAAGNVWTVQASLSPNSSAIRYDPQSADVQSYDQLDMSYTYSDMTGRAVASVACPPAR